MKLRISVIPELCGPVSVGTIDLIKIIRDQCNLGLAEAKAYVDDAVFGGEIVEIPLASDVDGPALIHGIETLETPATITADLIE
jgi:hypothetical protein